MSLSSERASITWIGQLFGYKLFDVIETKIDFSSEIKSGNVAAAIVMGAFLIGICIVIGRAIGS